jgi:hypothetical protein
MIARSCGEQHCVFPATNVNRCNLDHPDEAGDLSLVEVLCCCGPDRRRFDSAQRKPQIYPVLYTLYVPDAVVPPWPVQFV